MKAGYNLVDQPFIPCVLADGSFVELGLAQTLIRAHEIREIHHDSPLVRISIHRLLLALLHRNFGPSSFKEWARLREVGKWDEAKLKGYLKRWRDRFELFTDEHPFYQTPGLETRDPLPAAALYDELACGNNATLFDHSVDVHPQALSPCEVALGLVARQGFAIGFGRSPVCWVRGRKREVGYRRDGPLVRGVTLLARGDNLFETLLFNLTRPEGNRDDDIPIWERDDPEEVTGREKPFGTVDLYTWQSRRLRLVPADAAHPERGVTHLHFAQGRGLDKATIDPMKAYRKEQKEGWVPYPLREHRALWRDAAALFQLARDSDRPVAALNWLARGAEQGLIRSERQYSLDAFGVCTEAGKAGNLVLWRHDRIPLPLAYLKDAELVESLRHALDRAEHGGRVLRQSVWTTAAQALPQVGRGADRDQVMDFVNVLGPERLYWSHLEVPFRRFLVTLPGDRDHRLWALAQWVCTELRRRAWDAFENSAGKLDNSARLLRAVAQGRRRLAAQLATLSREYEEVLDGRTE